MYPLLSILNFKISTKPKTLKKKKKTISYFFRMMKHNARLKIHLPELNSQMKNLGPQNTRDVTLKPYFSLLKRMSFLFC